MRRSELVVRGAALSSTANRSASRSLHAGVLAVLGTIFMGCGDINISVPVRCTEPAPVLGIEGAWRGHVSGRELAMMLWQECTFFAFRTLWIVNGTWEWGSGSAGTAFVVGSQISLKGNAEVGTFRGLTINLNESPPFGATITGIATGELPATAFQSGPWTTITDESVTFERR
jgi:hypothetical protein